MKKYMNCEINSPSDNIKVNVALLSGCGGFATKSVGRVMCKLVAPGAGGY